MQGKAKYLGVIMGGTPQCVEDTRRGIFSYEALRSRLESSRFSDGSTRDLLSPIIRLKPLTPEEMYFLICKLEKIHAQVYKYEAGLSSETLQYFIKTEFSRVGAGQNITPREIIRDFIEILNILIQNPVYIYRIITVHTRKFFFITLKYIFKSMKIRQFDAPLHNFIILRQLNGLF